MATFISHSPEETLSLGARWAMQLQPGDVIALQGDLGAGKTQLVKGIARGLAVTERVQSPTFGLLISYLSGRLPLHHLDLYRLQSQADVVGAGLEDYLFHPDGVAVVEWPERWSSEEPGQARPISWKWVTLSSLDETTRQITYEGFEP